ncbi:MAG: hypothetical protein AAF682_24215 [Planctomycetota bacterium]
MKKLFLSFALLGLAVSCKSTTTDVTDTSEPAGECATACETVCDDEAAESCDSEAMVCPVTGKVSN